MSRRAGVARSAEFERGQHAWPYWRDALARALPRLVEAISP